MTLGPRERPIAPVGGTAVVPHGQRDPLRLGEEPLGAAQVELLALAVQHSGDDAGVARQPPDLRSREVLAGVDVRGSHSGAELVEVQGHDHGRVDLAAQPVGREVLEQLNEGPAVLLVPRQVLGSERLPCRLRHFVGSARALLPSGFRRLLGEASR